MTKLNNFKKLTATFLFAFGCCILNSLSTYAQQPLNSINTTISPAPFINNGMDSINAVDNSLDSLIMETYGENNYNRFPTFEDSVYDARLKSFNTVMPLVYNEEVKKFIDLYTLRRRDQVERMLGLSKFYFPIFEKILVENGVPADLKYMAIIESALNPMAISKSGAVGLWQFMPGTAKVYDLTVNSYLDERRDIIRSTEGAAAYMKNSYNIYGDWFLAIASYNCGPGNVNKAIAMSGGKMDFWSISKYLPKETRSYVPAFVAAMYVMNYYYAHDLQVREPEQSVCEISTVDVYQKLSCEQVAKYTNLSVEMVKFLNPGLRTNVIPAFNEPYALKLPSDKYCVYDAMKDSIICASKNCLVKNYTSYNGVKGNYYTHTVRSGESLGLIASKNKCTVAQLKSWNVIHNNMIYAGQKIKIYSGNGYSESHPTSGTKTTTTTSTTKPTTTSTTTSTSSTSSGAKTIYYKVKSGDSLWAIANKYSGVTVAEIKAANSPSKWSHLQPGMVLKINL